MISSGVSSEKSSRISASVMPLARYSKMSYTVIGIPRIQGLPLGLPEMNDSSTVAENIRHHLLLPHQPYARVRDVDSDKVED